MPRFSMIPSREKILSRIPEYAIDIEPVSVRVVVKYGNDVIADTRQSLLVKETKHADVYYLPRADVKMALFSPTLHSTYCPFKGHASYWTLTIGGKRDPNVVWSYETPYPEVAQLKDYLSFYTDRTSISIEP